MGTLQPLTACCAAAAAAAAVQVSVGAVLEVLLRTLNNKDAVTFSIASEGTPWLKRTYNSLTAAAQEVGDSRMFGGVHFPSANADGLKLGRLIGAQVFDRIAANKPASVNTPASFVSAACSSGAAVRQAGTGAAATATPAAATAAGAASGGSSMVMKKPGLTFNLGRRMA
jgi:hypothetical protein